MTDTPETVDLKSMSITDDQKAKLKQLFPEVFNEDKIDFDKLKRTLGEEIDEGEERFGMTWPGKNDCFKVIQEPSVGTLKPCKEESIDWDNTDNLFIEGDNLEVLKLLQRAYYGKIKMIYIDPPYNTGKEFVYPDKYSESLETYLAYTGQLDAEGVKFSTNTEAEGRFHSKWMSMMYPRLFLARNLLKDNGIIFISIGQDELANLLHLCFDLFGEENFVTICSRVMKTGGQKGLHFSPCVDYVIAFAKNINVLSPFREQISQNLIDKVYTKTEEKGPRKGDRYRTMGLYQAMLDKRANQRFYIECPDGTLVIPPGKSFPDQTSEGSQTDPHEGDGVWRWTYSRYFKERNADNIVFVESDKTSLVQPDGSKARWNIYYKIWLKDRMEDGQLPGNILEKFESRHSSAELKVLDIPFDFPKPSALIKFLMSICGVKKSEISLDFFAGSGPIGHAAIELSSETCENRPFICVQLPEICGEGSEAFNAGYNTIADIGKERIRRVIKKIEEEQAAKAKEAEGALPGMAEKQEEFDLGFKVFKLDKSNFNIWGGTVSEDGDIEGQLELAINHIDTDSSDEDILYEILLKAGFELTTKIKELNLADKKVYSIADNALLICLERNLTKEVITEMTRLQPARVICLDIGFADNDQLKTNAVQIMKSHDVEDFRTV